MTSPPCTRWTSAAVSPNGPRGPQTTVVGPICETGDVLARDRVFSEGVEDDGLLIAFAGTYGSAMASDASLRRRPRERVWGVESLPRSWPSLSQ